VGRDHGPWLAGEHGPVFGALLASAKRTVDPRWILNPEVLIPLEDGAASGASR
jgi:alkyldihydroxyacetonephosphate synthase